MIEMKLMNESEQINLKLKENTSSEGVEEIYIGSGEMPQGYKVQIDPSGEASGIVEDVRVNGTSILSDGVADIPIANETVEGVAKVMKSHGIKMNTTNNALTIAFAEEANIRNRNSNYYPIVPTKLDYAVKCAMTDGKGAEWTRDEKSRARARMGVEWRYIGKLETSEDVAKITMTLDSEGNPFSLRKVRVKVVNYPNASDLNTRIRLCLNGKTEDIFHDSEMMTGVKMSETARMCDVMVEKIGNQLFPIGIYASINNTNVWDTLTSHINYQYRYGSNVIDGYIEQVDLYSWTNAIGKGAYMEVWGVDA